MSNKKEIRVVFQTLTPLWTGDAWGECNEIKPSSIMGSLRFWFEVICYFTGITNNSNYKDGKLNDDLNEKEFKEKLLKNGADFEGIDKALAEYGVSLPSRIFGCTGWKGWIRIKKIESERDNFKNNLEERIINGKNWFWGATYYDGQFTITFEIEKEILEPIFYPLLTFIEKYGFLGGKWNIGYGRVKIESVDNELWKNKHLNKKDNEIEFKFNDKNSKKISELIEIKNDISMSVYSYELLKFFLGIDSFYCSKEREFQEKTTNLPKKIKVTIFENDFSDFQTLIQELLLVKAKIRSCLRPYASVIYKKEWNNFRHQLLGTTAGGTEGTKIIPWIYEENGQIKGGFVSIAGILKLGGN